MRGVAFWIFGASVAFLAAAGAFLLLASLGEDPKTSAPIPRAEPSEGATQALPQAAEPSLALELPADSLTRLERGPGQRLTLGVENAGDAEIASVEVTLDVYSENTARPRTLRYRNTLGLLAPRESATAEFEVDLSPPTPSAGDDYRETPNGEAPREILEFRATTPEGESDVKTAVLAP